MAVLLPNGKQYYTDSSTGLPLVGGKVYTYAAGTTTPKATYTTAAASTQNTNPVILDARGEATIFWSGAYKIVIKDSLDNTIWTADNIDTAADIASVSYDGVALSTILFSHFVYVVDSITDLRAVEKTNFTYAYVTGYYAAGDGGGGHYYYDSGDTTTADNGGSVIVATDSGRWKLLNNGRPYSVLQFGAKPDASTNASTAFTNAIAAASAASVQEVTVDGAFYLSSTVIVAEGMALVGRSNRYAQGEALSSYPSVILLADAATFDARDTSKIKGVLIAKQSMYDGGIYELPFADGATATSAVAAFAGTAITGSTYVGQSLEDLSIIGFEYATSGGLFKCKNVYVDCENAFTGAFEYLDDCYAGIFTTSGVSGAPQTRSGVALDSSGGYLNRCTLYQYMGGVVNSGDLTSDNCGFTVSGASDSAITLVAGNTVSRFRNCYIASASGVFPVTVETTNKYSFDNCTFVGGTSRSIDLDSGASYGLVSNSIWDATAVAGGDATATLKCVITTPLQAHNPVAWTPVLEIGGVTTGITYTTQTGRVVVNDNMVFVSGYILLTSKGSGVGGVSVTGLPYTSSNVAGACGSAAIVNYGNFDNPIPGVPYGFIAQNSDEIALKVAKLSGTYDALSNDDLTNSSEFYFTATYFIDR